MSGAVFAEQRRGAASVFGYQFYVAPPTPPPESGGGLSNRSGSYSAGIEKLRHIRYPEPKRVDPLDRIRQDDERILAMVRELFDAGMFDEETV